MKKTKQDLKCENCKEPIGSNKCTDCLSNTEKYTKQYKSTIEHSILNKPIKRIREYSIMVVDYDDGSRSLHRSNNGFLAFELLGLLEYIKDEIMKMIFPNENKPTFNHVTRTVKNCEITEIKKKDEIHNRS